MYINACYRVDVSCVLTHDPVLEAEELLLLFLPVLKVSVDQGLQLHQVFVLTLLLDVLRGTDRRRLSLTNSPNLIKNKHYNKMMETVANSFLHFADSFCSM